MQKQLGCCREEENESDPYAKNMFAVIYDIRSEMAFQITFKKKKKKKKAKK